jgi:hypothetical protein
MAALRVELSLASWEKEIIRETEDTFSEELSLVPCRASSLVSKDWVRNNWSWATHVQLQLQESFLDLDDEEIAIHQKNPARTWEILKNKLSSRAPADTSLEHYSCHSRLRQLLEANSDLPLLSSQTQLPVLLQDYIHFAGDDDEDWQAVWNFSKFIQHNHPRLRGVQLAIQELEKLEHLCPRTSNPEDDVGGNTSEAGSHRNPEAEDLSILSEHPAFEIYFMVRTVASYWRQLKVDLPKELLQMSPVS